MSQYQVNHANRGCMQSNNLKRIATISGYWRRFIMSMWEELEVETKVLEILDVYAHERDHHFGRPFLTAYQIAIAFKERYPDAFKRIGKPVGGKGTGQSHSLAQYIGTELSRRIKSRAIVQIEGRFLHRANLLSLQYEVDRQPLTSSAEKAYDLSMYRRLD